MEQPVDHTKILRVDVRGENTSLWSQLRPKLIARINEVLDSTLDHKRGTSFRDEAKQFTASMLEYARQRLQREGLENDRIEAEIAETYARRTSELAKAENTAADAEHKRQQTNLKELCIALGLTKAMLIGEEGEEAVVFGKQIECFLEVVKDMHLLSDA